MTFLGPWRHKTCFLKRSMAVFTLKILVLKLSAKVSGLSISLAMWIKAFSLLRVIKVLYKSRDLFFFYFVILAPLRRTCKAMGKAQVPKSICCSFISFSPFDLNSLNVNDHLQVTWLIFQEWICHILLRPPCKTTAKKFTKKVCCTCKVKPYQISPLFVHLAVKNKEGGGEMGVEGGGGGGELNNFLPLKKGGEGAFWRERTYLRGEASYRIYGHLVL